MGMADTSIDKAEKIILVGNPNVGKRVIFGNMTGRYVTVSNYPGTTVEVARGEIRGRGRSVEVIDTPGVYSLLPMSEDERVTRDILMREPGSRVLQVCDAKNMRRSLMITIQLAEMCVPFILAVNMADEARNRGVMPRLAGVESTGSCLFWKILPLPRFASITAKRSNVPSPEWRNSFRKRRRSASGPLPSCSCAGTTP